MANRVLTVTYWWTWVLGNKSFFLKQVTKFLANGEPQPAEFCVREGQQSWIS